MDGDYNVVSGSVVDAAVRIHKRIGPGLFESVYETVLARDLARTGLRVERQKRVGFEYDGMWFDEAFRADLVVESCVLVEIKSVPAIAPAHEKQVLTYIRLLDFRVGLLLNFGAALMRDGIRRIANRA